MKIFSDFQITAFDKNRAGLPTLSLLVVGFLAACSDSGVSGVYTPPNSQASPSDARPSLSAAQLANDLTVTAQTALTLPSETSDLEQAPVGEPAAANPDDNTSTDSQPETNENQDSTPASEQQEPVTGEDSSSSDTLRSSDLVDPLSVGNRAPENNNDDQRIFVSSTTPGFEGEVLEDAIRISWQEDPSARGYNVFKQGEYYITVFATEFIDTDVYDDDYYYEIQAFDFNDDRYYIARGLTVSARTFGRTDPNAPQPNESLLEDYELVFSDEFNDTTLDTSKWNTSFLWGTDVVINNEEQYYVDIVNEPDFGFNPFTFDGETLTINTIETPEELSEQANSQPFLSGIITSYDAFKFTYGYVETRAKMTAGRGYWPAFWLLNAYYVDAEPEIDIMEFIGQEQDVIYHTYHYFDSEGNLRSTESFPVSGIDFTNDFHTFGVEWNPGELVYYVDGIETLRVVDVNVSQQEMYVLANQAIGGWWAGSPDATTPFPGKYEIDYIRVYQRTTPHDVIQFDQPFDLIPLFSDNPGRVLPNKRPPFWLWSVGDPNGQQ